MFGKKIWVQILFLLTAFCISTAAQQNSPLKNEPKTENDAQFEKQRMIRQVAENNLKVQTALTEGISAFQSKKYDLAIAKFDEALNLEPDYWGTSTVILTNKARVLRTVGIKKYNEAARNYWNVSTEASSYFSDAVISLNRALQIFSNTPIEKAEANRASFDQYKFETIKELAECYRLLTLTDKTKTTEAIKAFEDYISIETNETNREKAVNELNKLKSK